MRGDSASEVGILVATFEESLMASKALKVADILEDFIWVKIIAKIRIKLREPFGKTITLGENHKS